MTYYVVCVTKHPYHQDPHKRIQSIGTSRVPGANRPTEQWTVDEMVVAIGNGNIFYTSDVRGDRIRVVIARHGTHLYVKTQNDGIQPNNLLSKRDCD